METFLMKSHKKFYEKLKIPLFVHFEHVLACLTTLSQQSGREVFRYFMSIYLPKTEFAHPSSLEIMMM